MSGREEPEPIRVVEGDLSRRGTDAFAVSPPLPTSLPPEAVAATTGTTPSGEAATTQAEASNSTDVQSTT